MLSERNEEVLEAIWVAEEMGQFTLQAVGHRCAITPTSEDYDELERLGLIVHRDDGVVFTEAGKSISAGIIRRHRLAEVLLTNVLKMSPEAMEEIACKVEHSLLPEVEESICTLLGHPGLCPDGKPIPLGKCCANQLKVVENRVISLDQLNPSEKGKITYIKPVTHSNFHQLLSFGLHPGVVLTVHRKYPAFCIKFGNTELALDNEIARNIFVWPLGRTGDNTAERT